jgi:Fe-S cluster assembly protein SufD
VIHVAAGKQAPPVRIVFLTSGTAVESHARVLAVVEDGAQADVIEVHAGEGGGFTNVVTEIVAGPGAHVGHLKLQRLPAEALHIARTSATLARDARFTSVGLAFGAALARNEVAVRFTAPGGECTLDGLWLGDRNQHLDQQTYVDHAQPHCSSRQLYKGVLGGTARGVFYGRVLVRQEAQQTSAHQTNRNLLLSETALVDTKPQLEIFADDVQCTHGATIGRLDPDAMFYLRSRGLPVPEAQDLLLQAFAYEILERVEPASVRAEIEAVLATRLAELGAAPRAAGRSST